MKKVYEVQAYYSGWYTDAFFSSKKKAVKYAKREAEKYKIEKKAGRMEFRVMERKVA